MSKVCRETVIDLGTNIYLYFTVNGRTDINIAIVESCQAFFAFEIPSVLIQERNKKFLRKVAVSGVTR